MAETIVRPLPVPAEVAVRSALLALANLGAELQTYNENSHTIVASMPKWFGVKKAAILVRVQDHNENCRMEIELPDKNHAEELLNQISLYLVDGHRAAGDITMRWVEQQDQGVAYSAGQQVARALKRFRPGAKSTPQPTEAVKQESSVSIEEGAETVEVVETVNETEAKEEPRELVLIDPDTEDNKPSFIIADPKSHRVHINVKPDVFADRSSHLETCPACQAVVLRGSQFCSACGRPVTMEAVSKEVNEGSRNTARSSLIFAGLGLAANLVTVYFFLVPLITNWASETGAEGAGLPAINLFLGIILGIIPSVLLGNEARRMAKTADIYFNFRFNKDQTGMAQAKWGRTLGWASIYINIGWLIFLVTRNFF